VFRLAERQAELWLIRAKLLKKKTTDRYFETVWQGLAWKRMADLHAMIARWEEQKRSSKYR
jgi:hypothetical protein